MAELFLIEDEIHDPGDVECAACASGYPTRCVCGGLMHAAGDLEEESEVVVTATKCGECGRSEDDLEQDVA